MDNIEVLNLCNEEGKIVKSTWSTGYEERFEYNEKGEMILSKDTDGVEIRFDHDEDGNCIHLESNSGYQQWMTYEEGRLVKREDSNINIMIY